MRDDLEMDPDEDPPQPPIGNQGNNGGADNNLDEGLELNAEDLLEVVDLNDAPPEPGMDASDGLCIGFIE